MITRLLPALLLLLGLLAATGHAQSMEAEWRVINDLSPTTVPAYQGQPNPFPQNQTAAVKAPVEDFTSELEHTKAETLARARALINSTQVFRPRLDGLLFNGYIRGADGARIFHDGKWMRVGDAINVPVKGAEAAYQVIEELKQLDKEAGKKVEEELQSRLVAKPEVTMKITKIDTEEVTLSDAEGQYKAPVSQGGF